MFKEPSYKIMGMAKASRNKTLVRK